MIMLNYILKTDKYAKKRDFFISSCFDVLVKHCDQRNVNIKYFDRKLQL